MGKEYRISRRIGVGGMAEVFLAMQRSLGGFEKIVVVKRIFEHLSEDDQFVSMFLEEARLAASLRHPNVVQIFDIDRDDAGYFIVMEYLPGEALADLFDDLRKRGEAMPVPIACRIGAAVAAGLHCAHTASDSYGQPQLIVHRDVTPSNVIVGYDGVTRLVDFGVAKARSRNGHTQAGIIKGKMSYLAPEQVDEDPVDARTDVFQLGIVLHELLTGQRLFRGQSDMERMSAVIGQKIARPSSLNPTVPPALDSIILRALERERERRTGSADQLRRDLEGLLRDLGEPVSDSDVAEWMQRTFPDRCDARAQLERDCMNDVRNHTGERIQIGESAVHSIPVPESPPHGSAGTGTTPTLATVLRRPRTDTRSQKRSWARVAWRAGAFVAAFGVAFGVSKLVGQMLSDDGAAAPAPLAAPAQEVTGEADAPAAGDDADEPETGDDTVREPPDASPQQIDTFQAIVATVPQDAIIELDGERLGVGQLVRTFERDGTEHELRVSARGYHDEVVTFVDEPPRTVIRLSRIARSEGATSGRGRVDAPEDLGEDADRAGPGDRSEDSSGEDGPDMPRTDNLNPWAD